MNAITADINGIIRELSLSEADLLVSLYESVVNSIQSIEELHSKEACTIRVVIERDKSQQQLFDQYASYPIKSVSVTDNGIGFTDANLHSFGQAYSAKKQKLGGKGIGRFAMLSFCNSIDVESVIETNNGNIKRALRLNKIEGLVKEEDKNTEEMRHTTVLLNNILEKYRKVSSKYSHEMLADAILSHCLLYYLDSNAPSIEIMEDNTIIKLDNQFNKSDFVLSQASRMLKNRTFTLYFVKSAKNPIV